MMNIEFLAAVEEMMFVMNSSRLLEWGEEEKRSRMVMRLVALLGPIEEKDDEASKVARSLTPARKQAVLRALDGRLVLADLKGPKLRVFNFLVESNLIAIAGNGEVCLTSLGRRVAWSLICSAANFGGRYAAYRRAVKWEARWDETRSPEITRLEAGDFS